MPEDLVVLTTNGKVRGKVQKDYHDGPFYSFSGIPYAKAPIGALRFKAPEPALPWNGIWDGTKEGWECPSLLIPTSFQVGKEDNCLNLNVYTKKLPSNNNTGKKPVMVFIHGGAFLYGSNRSYLYGPHYLLTEDIILVTINFRLGVLGFLSLDDPNLEVPGNAALKDQVMALKWVQANIHNFGGDSNNVTIFGESSGSASVHYLMLSPLTKGLFHKVIMQSGCALNPWAIGRRNASDIAKLMGYNMNIGEKTLLEKLKKASAKSIIKAQNNIDASFLASVVRAFGPVIEYPHEGAFLTEDPEKLMQDGKFHQVPVIIGYTSKEGLMFELLRKTQKNISLIKTLEKDIPHNLNIPEKSDIAKQLADKMKQFYYKDDDITEDNVDIRYTMFGDIIFVYGIHKTIRLLKKHSQAPVFVYKMTLTSSLNFFGNFCRTNSVYFYLILSSCINYLGALPYVDRLKHLRENLYAKKINGVSHADDIFYLFSCMLSSSVVKNSKEDFYIERFVKLWTNFAKYGDPTPQKLEIFNTVKWPQISSENIESILEIGTKLGIIENLEKERMAFLDKLYEK